MSRLATAAAILLAAAFSALHADDRPRELKVIARGDWPHLETHASAGIGTDPKPGERVIRTDAELAKAAGTGARLTVPKALGVAAIDFNKHMLLAVEDGTQPLVGTSGGAPPSALYAVEIARVERDDASKTMTVSWRRVPRAKDQGILTRPLAAVLVERFDGEVKFNRLPPADKAEKLPDPAGKPVAVAAKGLWPDGWPPEAPRKEWFVRDYAELIDPRLRAPEPVLERMRAEAAARYAKALKVDRIDFTKQMVIGVSGGVQPAGARVEVTRIETDPAGKTLTVHWRLHAPKPDAKPPGIAHPAEVVLVERFPGDIKFRQEKE